MRSTCGAMVISRTSGPASAVRGSCFADDRGEADGDRGFLSNGVEESCTGQVCNVMGDLKIAVGTGPFGMNDTF